MLKQKNLLIVMRWMPLIVNLNLETYKYSKNSTAVNHLFEKILKLKKLMLTEAGKLEAIKRHDFVIEFLKEYFYEEGCEEWLDYLNNNSQ